MVRKVIAITFAIALIMATAMPAHGMSGEIVEPNFTLYDESISSTYVNYFKQILSNFDMNLRNQEYILFRSGQYSYTLLYGEFDVDVIDCLVYPFYTSDYDVRYVTIETTNNYSNNDISVEWGYVRTVEWEPILYFGDNLVYSSSFPHPALIEEGVHYEKIACVLLAILIFMSVISRIFNYRKR